LVCEGHATTIRLIGRMRGEHPEASKAQSNCDGQKLALDLEEVSLVDVDVVRFLAKCQKDGTQLLHCSPYLHAWISRERHT
jgi:hypothetical protein